MTETPAQANSSEAYERGLERTENIMSQFLASADVQAVYDEPVEQGDYLIIPAAEIFSVAAFGMGTGFGSGPNDNAGQPQGAGGGGGGGGGRVMARPVAVIVAGPNGVEVKPVFDMTKIALAGITALGFMLAASRRMRRNRIP